LEYLAKNPKSNKNQVISGIRRNRNQVSQQIDILIEDGILISESGNATQPFILSIYPHAGKLDKNMYILEMATNLPYHTYFSKYQKKKLTYKDKSAIYDIAMANILPNLDMGQMFLWYSCATHGDISSQAEKDMFKSRNSINQIIRLVYNLDQEVCEMVKGTIKGRLLDSNHRLV